MVKSLQPNTNLLVLHLTRNSKLLFSEHTRTQAGPSKGGAILQMRHSSVNQNTKAPDHRGLLLMVRLSGDNLGNHAGANGTAAFADSEAQRSEEHTSELQSRPHLVCRLLLEKKKKKKTSTVSK